MKGKFKRFLSVLLIIAVGLNVFFALPFNPDSRVYAAEEIVDEIAEPEIILTGSLDDQDKVVLEWNSVESAVKYDIYAQDGHDYIGTVTTSIEGKISWTYEEELGEGEYTFQVIAYDIVDQLIVGSNIFSIDVVKHGDNYPPYLVIENSNPADDIQVMEIDFTQIDQTNGWTDFPTVIQAFGHIYSIEANEGGDFTPFSLKIYYTEDELAAVGLFESQLTGIYYYDHQTKDWIRYTNTGVEPTNVVVGEDEYAGYIYATIDHLTPIVPVADIAAPVSTLSALPVYTLTKTVNLTVNVEDQGGSGLDSMQLSYSKDSGLWQTYGEPIDLEISGLNPQTVNFQFDSTLLGDGVYSFKAEATDKAGNTEVKTQADAQTTVDTALLGEIKNLQLTKTDSYLILSWDPVVNAQGYIIKWGDNSANLTNQANIVGLTSAAIPLPDQSKVWYFSVTPYRTVGSTTLTGVSGQTQTQAIVQPATTQITVTPFVEIAKAAEPEPAQPQTIEERRPTPSAPVIQEPKTEEQPQIQPEQTPPKDEESENKNWSTLIIVLSILIIAAAAASGYYGYQWWMIKDIDKKKKKNITSRKTKTRW